MESLFGDLCCGDRFAHDEAMYVKHNLRQHRWRAKRQRLKNDLQPRNGTSGSEHDSPAQFPRSLAVNLNGHQQPDCLESGPFATHRDMRQEAPGSLQDSCSIPNHTVKKHSPSRLGKQPASCCTTEYMRIDMRSQSERNVKTLIEPSGSNGTSSFDTAPSTVHRNSELDESEDDEDDVNSEVDTQMTISTTAFESQEAGAVTDERRDDNTNCRKELYKAYNDTADQGEGVHLGLITTGGGYWQEEVEL